METINQEKWEQWGLSMEAIQQLGERLEAYWQEHGRYTKSRTRDTSEYGREYISGMLRMETERNITNIARKTEVAPQNMQHFISHSPWSGQELMKSIRRSLINRAEYQEESILIIEESAEAKAGEQSAGAGRQHNGRLGKVDQCQVGVFLGISNRGNHSWIDGELYLPANWFEDAQAARRKRAGIPEERQFQTKLELGLQMVKRVQSEGVPFVAVDCDTLYGRKGWLRDELDACGIEYYADVPVNSRVYLEKPDKPQCPSPPLYEVKDLLAHPDLYWQTLTLRANERGFLKADFARCRVWTLREDDSLREEWLLIRQEDKRLTFSLSNAPTDILLSLMASRKAQRYFIERSIQDAKSELGWDEFQAFKYRAWQHHLALTIAASWFITETRLDWAQQYERDPVLLEHYQTDILPALSMSNVRELLRAALPLPRLSPSQAAALVVKHLDNRTRSRKSRLSKARSP